MQAACPSGDEKLFIICLSSSMGLCMNNKRLPPQAGDAKSSGSAEEDLALIESRFRDFLEPSADWLWETDLEQRYTYYSGGGLPEFGDPIGMTRHELLRKMKVEPADLPDVIAGYLKKGLPFRNLEYPFVTSSGSVIWVRLSAMPIRDKDGRLSGYRGSATNVTRSYEAALRFAERLARYASMCANAAESLYPGSPDGALLEPNPALARMHGFYGVDELLRVNRCPLRRYEDPRDRARLVQQAL